MSSLSSSSAMEQHARTQVDDDTAAIEADWNVFKARELRPRVRASSWHPINAAVRLASYFPTMERWYESGITAYKKQEWMKSYVFFVRVAEYILEELRAHPSWNSPANKKGCNRMITVVAQRSIKYAETCEVHLKNMLQRNREARAAQMKADAEAKAEADAKANVKEHDETRLEGHTSTDSGWRNSLIMYVNGKRIEITAEQNIDPSMPLVDYLRDELGLTGTKIGCGEGGCGACSVLMSLDNENSSTSHCIINACLRPLAACDGASITTVEGVGTQHKMHPVQSRLASCNGSQCGFCTPGWVMNGFAMLMNDPSPASVKQVQDRFDGNLCRCTGMRAILEAMSSFVPPSKTDNTGAAAVADDKDAKCKPSDAVPSHDVTQGNRWRKHPEPLLAEYDADAQRALAESLLPKELWTDQRKRRAPLQLSDNGHLGARSKSDHGVSSKVSSSPTWYAPDSLTGLSSIVGPLLSSSKSFDLILGGTTRGVKKYYNGEVVNSPSKKENISHWAGRPTVANGGHSVSTLISTQHVAELQRINVKDDNSIVAGSAVTLTQIITTLESTGKQDEGHLQLARHLSRVANLQVRNVGGWAGNLALARQFPNFPSDVLTTMSAAGASLQIQRWPRNTKNERAEEKDNHSDSLANLEPRTISLPVATWVTGTNGPTMNGLKMDANSFFDVLLYITIPPTAPSSSPGPTTPRISFSSFKLARRQQNAHALVNLAACLTIDNSTEEIKAASVYLHADDEKVPALVHASTTCDQLIGKTVTSQTTLASALSAICEDLSRCSEGATVLPYTKSACQSLLYKVLLAAQPKGTLPSNLSSATLWQLPRGVSTGSEVWYPPSPSNEPLPAGQGMTKIRAPLQCTGQAKYASDYFAGSQQGLLHAAPVQATRALAILSKFDPSIALNMPGVLDVVTADDIDTAGGAVNNCGVDASDNAGVDSPEEIFVPLPTTVASGSPSGLQADGGKVQFVGQTIALVIATSKEQARAAARVMMDPSSGAIDYVDCDGEAPILTINDAIAANKFYQGTHCKLMERLEPGVQSIDDALSKSQHTWSGSLYFSGQRHFYFETQRAVVYPTEDDGLLVRSSTQGPTVVAKYVAKATGLRMHNVTAKQVRAGGAFGGKLTRNLPVACAAAVAARKLNAPVSLVLDRVGDQQVTGGREPIRMDITVGFDSDTMNMSQDTFIDAKLPVVRAFKLSLFMDGGWTLDSTFQDLDMATHWSDNAYCIPNFHCQSRAVQTNTPSTTSMRAPGVLHSVVAIETAFDQIATLMNVNVDELRAAHFYRVGDVTPYGQTIKYQSLPKCWSQVQSQAKYADLQTACDDFNAKNRWVKRSVSLAPAKYGIGWDTTQSGCTVSIYGPDGSIVIQHGGCELGQGLNTKVAQAAASVLGLSCSTTDLSRYVRIEATSSKSVANNSMTGGSSTSEVTSQAVMNACAVLVKRLAPYRDSPSKGGKGLSWEDACAAALGDRIQLSAEGWFAPPPAIGDLDFSFKYFVYAAAVTVVELDVLTGQAQILSTDIVYDCGQSLNPIIDVGQIEGGFVMGIGTWLTEEANPDVEGGTGRLLENGTWEYKPPCSKDIPVEFNCTLLKDNPNVAGILGSKATAEPPMILSNSVYFALRKCIISARVDSGMSLGDAGNFLLPAPATAERVVAAIGTNPLAEFHI